MSYSLLMYPGPRGVVRTACGPRGVVRTACGRELEVYNTSSYSENVIKLTISCRRSTLKTPVMSVRQFSRDRERGRGSIDEAQARSRQLRIRLRQGSQKTM